MMLNRNQSYWLFWCLRHLLVQVEVTLFFSENGWMASSTRWTWVWASSGTKWRTGKPGVLQSMGLQRGEHDWETEQQPVSQGSAVNQAWLRFSLWVSHLLWDSVLDPPNHLRNSYWAQTVQLNELTLVNCQAHAGGAQQRPLWLGGESGG